VLYSHELGSTRAKYTVQLGQSNKFLYTVSNQQIKPWSFLSVSASRAEHTTSYMSNQQTKTLSSFTARQPIQILGKGVTSLVFVTGDGVYDTWDQFIAGVHKAGNIF
jgi:hypothetical protein